jgi:hypothetical protein
VSAPDEAAIAVGYCSATLDWLSQRTRLRPFQLTIAIVLVADLLITWTVPVVPLLAAALGLAFLQLRTPVMRRRLSAALDANAEVAEELDLSPIRVQLPGESWLRPGRRRRGVVIFLGTALGFLTYILIATSFFVPDSRALSAKARSAWPGPVFGNVPR